MINKITSEIFDVYNSIGKTGKPERFAEWTLLSGFIIETINVEVSAASVATGTKCLGSTLVCEDGMTVNDSHAEVLARRGFLKYLFDQVRITKEKGSSYIFSHISNANKCVLKDNVKIHFYTSHVPCGDASIIEMSTDEAEKVGEKRKNFKLNNSEPEKIKKVKLDIHRTGAKPVPTDPRKDPRLEGTLYHLRGAVRTKPGRGDPTSSLSCSDKMARWIYTGVQGALLSHLIEEPLHLESVIIGGGSQFEKKVIAQALVGRSGSSRSPNFFQTELIFQDSIVATKATKPCPKSLIWVNVQDKKLEVCVEGRKLGCTKKNKIKGCLSICRRELFKQFLSLAGTDFSGLTYREAKDKAVNYQKLSEEFKKVMGAWSVDKSKMQQFKLENL